MKNVFDEALLLRNMTNELLQWDSFIYNTKVLFLATARLHYKIGRQEFCISTLAAIWYSSKDNHKM